MITLIIHTLHALVWTITVCADYIFKLTVLANEICYDASGLYIWRCMLMITSHGHLSRALHNKDHLIILNIWSRYTFQCQADALKLSPRLCCPFDLSALFVILFQSLLCLQRLILIMAGWSFSKRLMYRHYVFDILYIPRVAYRVVQTTDKSTGTLFHAEHVLVVW